MKFEIAGEITNIETIAAGRSIRVLQSLNKKYGKGRRRKKKGIATVKLKDGSFGSRKFIGMKRTASAKRI